MNKRDYDGTVARIAGNLLSGYIERFGGIPIESIKIAVEAARQIVAETKATEPVNEV